MNHIYCISGFGADERVFSRLGLSACQVHYISWLVPEKKEALQSYAKRMAEQVKHADSILLGLSFGGMMGIEMAKILNVKAVILISSIKNYHELPVWMELAGKLKLNYLLPLRSVRLTEPFQNYNLGLESSEERQMVREYRLKINQQYTNWAVNIILNWKNEWLPDNLFHIHGKNDRIFPFRKVREVISIETGGHMMIMNRADKVNEAVETILRMLER